MSHNARAARGDWARQASVPTIPKKMGSIAAKSKRSRREGFFLISITGSVRRELLHVRVGHGSWHGALPLLLQHEVVDHKHVDVGRHEAAVRVRGCSDNGFAANVERC